MRDEILAGMVRKLETLDIPVYVRGTKQEGDSAYFLVLPLTSSVEKVIGSRYRLNHSFEVQYYPPKDGESVQESVEDVLFQLLEYILMGEDLIHGTKMHTKNEEGIFHFYVDYNFYSYKEVEEKVDMGDVDIKNGLKGD
ncbi:phage tail terminator family protein [Sinanaerobacter sp. ZZT-01]|uniref:phage tail terminator family protein n=1 Tax=Sinanaerobacter sp. ZZT-01 TaxID=3111540 RepID=UPI002D788016|nr:hypothetical protein [Sinanaerobacter sp. ZZT-01]WRR94094.1 hypothetical protein U5921_02950 [Sinanaerobacter sp. ZZT-01]